MNGALIPWTDARVHVLTMVCTMPQACLRGTRLCGRFFKLREHTERLFIRPKSWGFEIPIRPVN
ncbi:MAG: hypothetical protein CM15mP21_2350 [Hyphomicrobiales bacterium]|nr:MAG: hypothetical protein CM15mP21_2350 [Hyphomicrobiales bacterium]